MRFMNWTKSKIVRLTDTIIEQGSSHSIEFLAKRYGLWSDNSWNTCRTIYIGFSEMQTFRTLNYMQALLA